MSVDLCDVVGKVDVGSSHEEGDDGQDYEICNKRVSLLISRIETSDTRGTH